MKIPRIKGSIEKRLVTLMLIFVLGAFCVSTAGLSRQARFLPLLVGLPTLALLLVQIVIDVRNPHRTPGLAPVRRSILLPACVLLAGLYLVGFLVTIPIFAATEWKRAGAGWPATLAIGVFAAVLMAGSFYLVAELAPPAGLLWNW